MADDPYLLRDLWTASWMSKGKPYTERDETAWRAYSAALLARGPEIRYRSQVFPELDAGRAYRMDRMLGWQSGGEDIPPYGKWASPPTPFHDVPPFPGDAPPEPVPVPPAPPGPPTPPAESVTDLATVLARMNARFDNLERLAERAYTGTVKLPAVLGGGSRTITLHPVTPRGKPGDGA